VRLPLIGLVIALLSASCADSESAARSPSDGGQTGIPGPVALPDAGECPVVLLRASARGCIVEWSCLEAGVLLLACGPPDERRDASSDASDDIDAGDGSAGSNAVMCTCAPEDQAATNVDTSPTTCSADDARQFARQACGWTFL